MAGEQLQVTTRVTTREQVTEVGVVDDPERQIGRYRGFHEQVLEFALAELALFNPTNRQRRSLDAGAILVRLRVQVLIDVARSAVGVAPVAGRRLHKFANGADPLRTVVREL